jgi:hypothetical protein
VVVQAVAVAYSMALIRLELAALELQIKVMPVELDSMVVHFLPVVVVVLVQ